MSQNLLYFYFYIFFDNLIKQDNSLTVLTVLQRRDKSLLFFLLFLISTSIREHVRNDTETVFHKMLFFLLLFSSLPLAASVKLREVFFSSLRRTREN